MKLTGKCKEDFEMWWLCEYKSAYDILENFYKLREPMWYGVYVDFFDTALIHLQVRAYFDRFESKVEQIDTKQRKVNQYSELYNTREVARTAAIEKANEIYNETPDR